MRRDVTLLMGVFVIAIGALVSADPAHAKSGDGAGTGGGGAAAAGGPGGAGPGAPGDPGTGPGAPGDPGAAPGDAAGPGTSANTNPIGNWLPTYAWVEPDPAATVVVTPDGRRVTVKADPTFPATSPAADPMFRTFYPGICPDIDYRTDTLCYQTP